jgi:hypothetical protein
MEVYSQLHAPATLLGKCLPVPTGKEARWPPEPVWMLWKWNLVVQPVAHRYTDQAIETQDEYIVHQHFL